MAECLAHLSHYMKGLNDMRQLLTISICSILLVGSLQAGVLTDTWAYHDDNDDIDDRISESVPGGQATFLGNGSSVISSADPITLYVLTDQNFAGEREEQVLVRWWNGEKEEWIMGSWERNIEIGSDSVLSPEFHGLPLTGTTTVDLWKIEIPAETTLPGENFYTIQLKGWTEDDSIGMFLLRDMKTSGSRKNFLGQAITDGDYFGHDWSVTITE